MRFRCGGRSVEQWRLVLGVCPRCFQWNVGVWLNRAGMRLGLKKNNSTAARGPGTRESLRRCTLQTRRPLSKTAMPRPWGPRGTIQFGRDPGGALCNRSRVLQCARPPRAHARPTTHRANRRGVRTGRPSDVPERNSRNSPSRWCMTPRLPSDEPGVRRRVFRAFRASLTATGEKCCFSRPQRALGAKKMGALGAKSGGEPTKS